jgi:hypothetical protein
MPFLVCRTLCLIFLATVATIPGVRAQEVTATGGAAGPKFRSYGDERSVRVDDELAALRAANEGLVGSVKRQPLSFAAALTHVRELAKSAGGPDALAPVLSRLPDKEPNTLRLVALGELAHSRPTGVLLLLLAAYDRNPAYADTLADLAGVLASLGYANEAMACLDELELRHAVPSPPMGISGSDALAYLRGYCLVRFGEVAAAKPLLAGVVARQPLLAEAARLLALITEGEEQRKNFLLGVWRHRPPLTVSDQTDFTKPELDPMKEGDEVAADLREILDLSRGEEGRLPDVPHARSVLHANGLIPVLQEAEDEADRQFGAILAQRQEPRSFRHPDGMVQETWAGHTNRILRSLEYRDRKLRDLERIRHTAYEDRLKAFEKIEARKREGAEPAVEKFMANLVAKHAPPPTLEQIGEVARPYFESALSQARGSIQQEEIAERNLFKEWHLLATALVAQVGDPAWHEYFRLTIEAQRWQKYSRLLSLAQAQAAMGAHPFITKEPGEVPPPAEAQPVDQCDGNKSMSFSTDDLPGHELLPAEVGVEVSCEGMSVELGIDTHIPGVSASTELGFDNKGQITAFVGPKAEVNLGNKEIAAFTGSAKAGAYITGNRDGITDAGVKAEVKVGGRIGAISGSQKVAEGKVSFLPAPATGEGGFEPLIINGTR